jgi:A/G-specific adenine glycosylase
MLDVPGLVEWYPTNARELPWRRPDYGAWGVLTSEVMLQQTPVARVVPAVSAWLSRWPTPADLASASTGDAVRQWGTLGYPRRAVRLHAAAGAILTVHGGVVPADVAALEALPGVGTYTARAVAVFAYGQRHPVVDVNTRRVIARAVHGRAHPGPPAAADLDAMADLLPEDAAVAATVNAAVMELGATVCIARAPRCAACVLRDTCRWRAAGHPGSEDRRPRQARYRGSDRHARGTVLASLRSADDDGVLHDRVLADWPDPDQRERAIASLLADGLIEAAGTMLRLPAGAQTSGAEPVPAA